MTIALEQKKKDLQKLNELTKGSTATGKDIRELAKAIKQGVAKWHSQQTQEAF